MLIHEQAHQLRDGHHRVGVVEMDRLAGRELAEVAAVGQEAGQDALQGGADEEVLLLEAQLLAGGGVVVRVEDLGDGLVQGLFLHGAQIIAMVEIAQVKAVAGDRAPQNQGVGHAVAKARDQHLVRQGRDGIVRVPGHPQVAGGILLVGGVAAEADLVDFLRARGLPGVAEEEPVVRALDLMAVADLLTEHAVFVTDAITAGGVTLGRQGVQKTGRQAPQAAVAQAGVVFPFVHILQHLAQAADGLAGLVLQIQVEHGVLQGPPGQELQGQIVDALGPLVAVALLGAQPVVHQGPSHRQCQAVVLVVGLGLVGFTAEGQAQGEEALLGQGEPDGGGGGGCFFSGHSCYSPAESDCPTDAGPPGDGPPQQAATSGFVSRSGPRAWQGGVCRSSGKKDTSPLGLPPSPG